MEKEEGDGGGGRRWIRRREMEEEEQHRALIQGVVDNEAPGPLARPDYP